MNMKREIKIPQGALIGPNKLPIYGYKTVKAHCIAGLAVVKGQVYHEESGLKIGFLDGENEHAAIANIKIACAMGIDFTKSASEIVKYLRENHGAMIALNMIYAATLDAM